MLSRDRRATAGMPEYTHAMRDPVIFRRSGTFHGFRETRKADMCSPGGEPEGSETGERFSQKLRC